jgi:hypothetical protein
MKKESIMSEKIELDHLTNEQLIEEIKRQWVDKAQDDYDRQAHGEATGPAYDYMSSDIEQHIEWLVAEAKSRGLELPERYAYVAQFLPGGVGAD